MGFGDTNMIRERLEKLEKEQADHWHGGAADGLNAWIASTPTAEAQAKNDTDNRPAWYSLAYIMKN